MLRIKKLRQLFNQIGIDALLISNFYNILYLTNFKSLTQNEREAWLLITNDNVYLFTDRRYLNKDLQLSDGDIQLKLIEPDKGIFEHLKEIINKEKITSLGVEGEDLRLIEYERLRKVFFNLRIITTQKLIVKLREIKDTQEIKKIKQSCQLADQCLKEIVKTLKIGMKEKEIAFKIEDWLREKDCQLAFFPIVAIDKNTSLPHYNTKEGKGEVGKSSVILIDFGVKYQDYNSDITRMIFIAPSAQILNIYQRLLSIQKKTIKAIGQQSLLNSREIDIYCRKLITESELPNYCHSTGHGVGLEIHEYPKISQKSVDRLHLGQVFTIEPGVYFEDKWGMRIEDTILINDNNQAEVLTNFSKEPLILKL